MDKFYEITILNAYGYDGPNPISAKGIGIVHGPKILNWQESDFMLKIIEPFICEGKKAQYLLVSPRHEGVTIDDVQTIECFVGIGKVEPKHKITITKRYSKDDVTYWATGRIKPIIEK